MEQSEVRLSPRRNALVHTRAWRTGSGDEREAVDWSSERIASTALASLGAKKVYRGDKIEYTLTAKQGDAPFSAMYKGWFQIRFTRTSLFVKWKMDLWALGKK